MSLKLDLELDQLDLYLLASGPSAVVGYPGWQTGSTKQEVGLGAQFDGVLGSFGLSMLSWVGKSGIVLKTKHRDEWLRQDYTYNIL